MVLSTTSKEEPIVMQPLLSASRQLQILFVTLVLFGSASADTLPAELTSLSTNLIFEESFDDAPDFVSPMARSGCVQGRPAENCALLPPGWTGYISREFWHPDEFGPTSQAGMQINSAQGRGGMGKSMQIWDESQGGPGTWGSDVMLGKAFTPGYKDIYVEYWIKFQPGYRWHHADPSINHGINYAKLLRIGHADEGKTPFSFGGRGPNGPISFINSRVWYYNPPVDGQRNSRAGFAGTIRCDPQETDYTCPDYDFSSRSTVGYLNSESGYVSFEDSFGDGGWHKLAARMALNSSPGANDGILQIWYDDQLIANATDIPFLSSTAPADHLLNSVVLGGNLHNYPEAESERFEQWHAIDDVKIYAINEPDHNNQACELISSSM